MEKVRYMISDAANIVNVESHVLRYWEEELELQIPRNEMGHRYYTEDNIEEFQKIKEWKEQGYQLKAIKIMVHSCETEKHFDPMPVQKTEIRNIHETEIIPKPQGNPVSNTVKLEQFQTMMMSIVKMAVEENNQALGKEVGMQVGEHVIKEMNYLMRVQDDAEEERFRKLDTALRAQQKGRRMKKEKVEKEKRGFGREKKLNPNLTV